MICDTPDSPLNPSSAASCVDKGRVDIPAVDWPERGQRFDVVYHWLNLASQERLRVKVPVADGASVASLAGLVKTANWVEREVFDPVSYTHLRAHETVIDLVCRLLLEKKKKHTHNTHNNISVWNYKTLDADIR